MNKYGGVPEKYKKKPRFCGYCGTARTCTQEELLTHTIRCEIDNLNNNYGELNGGKS